MFSPGLIGRRGTVMERSGGREPDRRPIQERFRVALRISGRFAHGLFLPGALSETAWSMEISSDDSCPTVVSIAGSADTSTTSGDKEGAASVAGTEAGGTIMPACC